MNSTILQSLVAVQSAEPARRLSSETAAALHAPLPALHQTRSAPPAPTKDRLELRPLPTPADPSGPADAIATAAPLPLHDDLEMMSRPGTPDDPPADAAVVVPTVWEPYMNRFRLLLTCATALAEGMSDSAAGALIPYMEKYYDIGYAQVSLIFVGQALGFVVAALFLDSLRHSLGHARTLGLAQALMALSYAPMIAGAPFPVVVLAFFAVGFGIAVNVAIANTFCGSLAGGTFVLGCMHGCYGLGGVSGPLVATSIVAAAGAPWTRYYVLTAGVFALSVGAALWAFKGYDAELQHGGGGAAATTRREALWSMFGSMRTRLVLLGATFIFCYQGAEVSISGWVISFLISARDGTPASVGYVTAGFWGGITLGRFLLVAPAQRVGERRFVYGLVIGALIFELLVWLVPNVIGNAVAVSIVGVLLGPVYPCAMSAFLRGMAPRETLSGMGTISAFGSMGGAVWPFIVGLIAQAVGTWVLHPIVIFLFLCMLLCWYGIPEPKRRNE
ncbi:Major facilitator superfamily domain, general substrate transporter [Cordyceps fumosorosea ARSEF 2679]|uniref:Major facilitator superfamily domain, general substrate transporter n=1 Tax=Cordyceps fumosorosea (strain ARSEF 2679) TaxID=1081104 RepID=A0A162MSF7_CORFA|nr:Major facilitator superfamily domain, general substrate transporter [Cordyceps fumosorosea ARSEF 2679]OAA69549.1 Major facilitator superfamily domain, general substrate transporter [Cordyceps fumosorosea ARSEF 2679]